MKPTLLILAAGMGSRYGGLKQIDGVGPHDEAIIEYSIYDAIRAGFGKITFVIRKDIEAAFKARFEAIKPADVTFEYVFQELDSCTEGHLHGDRTKPWGTAHAVLVAKDAIKEPFAVINADDYYGKDAYRIMADWLNLHCRSDLGAMMGYRLANTLSDHGFVSRGVCAVDDQGYLLRIDERTQVQWQESDVIYMEGDKAFQVDPESAVSMNFWGFHPDIFPALQASFLRFITANAGQPKAEFFIPLIVQEGMDASNMAVQVLPCPDKWIGVTYREDKPVVQAAFAEMTARGIYPSPLWS
jgi:UTP-glucose-1-phosphate uridylyltransferase